MNSCPQAIEAVVFDIGGVLSAPEGGVKEVADALGLDPQVVAPAYWADRGVYDKGSDREAYWRSVGDHLRISIGPDLSAELDLVDSSRWAEVVPSARSLLQDVIGSTTVLTGVLSNAPHTFAKVVRQAAWSDRLTYLLFSCEVGSAKPDPHTYEETERTFGVAPDAIVFFDDRPVNVEAATLRGWHARLWDGPEDARTYLRARGVLGD